MECDKSCLDMKTYKHGRTAPRRYPLDRLCCAVSLMLAQDEIGRHSTLRVISARIGKEHAQRVATLWREATSGTDAAEQGQARRA